MKLKNEKLEQTEETAKAVSAPLDSKKAKPKATMESKYSAAELAHAARVRFAAAPEVVTAALKFAGKESATLAEAQQAVKKFLERKVK